MTTNIATTKEQSVRLLQCGVDPETADMTFTPHNTLSADPYKEALKDRGISLHGHYRLCSNLYLKRSRMDLNLI